MKVSDCKHSRRIAALSITLLLEVMMVFAQDKMPPPMEECIREPVKYTGLLQPAKDLHDGRLPHAAGAHHYQVFRANRQEPVGDHEVGRTYNHQPYLAYWNGKFYLQFLLSLIHI